MEKCPNCGYEYDTSRFILTENERLIIETLRDLRPSPLSPVETQTVADVTGYSSSQVRRYLSRMQQHGVLTRPRGCRSGWVESSVMREIDHALRGCHTM